MPKEIEMQNPGGTQSPVGEQLAQCHRDEVAEHPLFCGIKVVERGRSLEPPGNSSSLLQGKPHGRNAEDGFVK